GNRYRWIFDSSRTSARWWWNFSRYIFKWTLVCLDGGPLESDGASVVNIASSAGQFAIRGMSAYGTAKAALIHLTRELAQDLSPKVRVNAVSPGAIATSALDIVLQTPELHDAMLDGTPMRRLGDPDDIAAAVLFLASPAASYVTGEVLAVNGGIQGSNLELGIPDL
ncbi:MAG: SDR family oxidoreductase, partial [Actinomycetota bacterium]|nr:SDR family oxidoreductase [Actinomycetota bacterium]